MAEYEVTLKLEENGEVLDAVELTDGVSFSLGPGAVSAPPPPLRESWGADNFYRHGSDLVRAVYGNSSVRIHLSVLGPDVASVKDNLHRIMRMLELARLRQVRGRGPKVKIYRGFGNRIVSKEVFSGRLTPAAEDVAALVKDGILSATLDLVCYPFWQGEEACLVDWTTVQNHDNGTDPYYVDVSGDEIEGTAPGLLRLLVENFSSSGNPYVRLRVGLIASREASSYLAIQQCEDWVLVFDAAVVSGSEFSQGEAVRVTPSDTTNVARIAYNAPLGWPPPGSYRVFVRARNNDTDRTVKLQLWMGTSAREYYRTPQVEIPTPAFGTLWKMVDLGVIEVPPWRTSCNWRISFDLFGQSDAASGSYDLDYLLFLPLDQSKLMSFEVFPHAYALEVYGLEPPPMTYLRSIIPGHFYDLPVSDLGYMGELWPGLDHRFFFSADEDPGVGEPVNELNSIMRVYIGYIPQWLYVG